MENKHVHIIGGTGQMGRLLKNFLEGKGLSVTVSGLSSENTEDLAKAQLIFVSVPNEVAPQVITNLAPQIQPDALIVDLSSVKTHTAQALEKTGHGALALHMLFGPTVSTLQNQKIIFCTIKDHHLIPKLQALFTEAGSQVLTMTIEEHDKTMAHIQALTHFANLSLGKVLLDDGIDIAGKISTPVFLAQLSAMSRVLAQDATMMAQIQIENPYFYEIAKAYIAYQQSLVDSIAAKDVERLTQQYQNVHDHLESSTNKAPTAPKPLLAKKRLPQGSHSLAYLGPEGTFSQQAAIAVYQASDQENTVILRRLAKASLSVTADPSAEDSFGSTPQNDKQDSTSLIPCSTIADIFQAVAKGKADYGIVPAENTIEGTVRETLDYLVDYDVKIQFGFDLPIQQNLLSKEKDLASITKVISHPQAINQSRSWLAQNLPQAQIIYGTSTTAALTADEAGVAVIGSVLAAPIYHANILAQNIQEHNDNVTRFYVIAKTLPVASHPNAKTLAFLTIYNRVGILRDMLSVFADNEINLSRIESRPSKEKAWDYYFFVQVDVPSNDPKLVQALNILKQYCPVITILGEI